RPCIHLLSRSRSHWVAWFTLRNRAQNSLRELQPSAAAAIRNFAAKETATAPLPCTPMVAPENALDFGGMSRNLQAVPHAIVKDCADFIYRPRMGRRCLELPGEAVKRECRGRDRN